VQIHNPAAMTNAARPLALMFMEISPKYRPPMAARETAQVFTPGQKKGIFGRVRRKRGMNTAAAAIVSTDVGKNLPLKSRRRMSL
jgi:hypothetical protein